MKKTDILILGAGCAGTLLAHYLACFGYQGSVVLLDVRTNFDREQRWCGWAKLPDFLTPVISKSWKNWTVCDENKSVTRTSGEYIYQEIYAPKFYEHFHSNWKNPDSDIQLNLGEKVLEVVETQEFIEVLTDKNTWRATLVFDARNEGSKNFQTLSSEKKLSLNQIFLGLQLEFEEAIFDPQTAVLMDFRTPQFDGLNFIYVLPYSEKTAFFESTSFTESSFDKEKHKQAIFDYADKFFGKKFTVKSEEIGVLPMTTAKFRAKQSEKIYSIGVAGGYARPSSAYALHRNLRQTAKIAEAVVNKTEIPTNVAPPKFDLLDAVLLEAIKRNPKIARKYFVEMFDKLKPETLIRFMLDESSLTEDLAVMNTSPKTRFGIFTLQSLKRKIF
jgi:lycopene beta-cyclase